jgi:hypothetical protein
VKPCPIPIPNAAIMVNDAPNADIPKTMLLVFTNGYNINLPFIVQVLIFLMMILVSGDGHPDLNTIDHGKDKGL